MKKLEIRMLAEFFGAQLPASKIKNREVCIDIVRLYGSLAKANKEIGEEMEDLRKNLVGDKEEELKKYSDLLQKANDEKLDEKERKKAKKEADAMTECVKIDQDFREAANKLFEEDSDADIKKVSLETLYEALCDCGFSGFAQELPIAAVEANFANVIA